MRQRVTQPLCVLILAKPNGLQRPRLKAQVGEGEGSDGQNIIDGIASGVSIHAPNEGSDACNMRD